MNAILNTYQQCMDLEEVPDHMARVENRHWNVKLKPNHLEQVDHLRQIATFCNDKPTNRKKNVRGLNVFCEMFYL